MKTDKALDEIALATMDHLKDGSFIILPNTLRKRIGDILESFAKERERERDITWINALGSAKHLTAKQTEFILKVVNKSEADKKK